MSAGDHYNEFVGKRFIGITILTTLIFWVVFTFLLLPFVPTNALPWLYIWSAFTATPLAGVFFLAQHMVWVVAMEHRRAQQQRS